MPRTTTHHKIRRARGIPTTGEAGGSGSVIQEQKNAAPKPKRVRKPKAKK